MAKANLAVAEHYFRLADASTDRQPFAGLVTTVQINGTLEKKLKKYTRPELLLLDELGYLPIDKRGAGLMYQVVAAR